MTGEDYYAVLLQPAQQSFVYVLQREASGQIDVLLPDPQVPPQTNPVSAERVVWVPKDSHHWFSLDEQVGWETIIVIASAQRDEEMEALLRKASEAEQQEALVQRVAAAERAVGKIRQSEAASHATSDGQVLNVEVSVVESEAAVFVYTLTFEHQ